METIHCLLGLLLLPASETAQAVCEICDAIDSTPQLAPKLQQLIAYVQRQWLDKQSIGPNRLNVLNHRSKKNNILESYHAVLHRCIKVARPNLSLFWVIYNAQPLTT